VNNLRTVSDTKRAFYALHTRPINSIYRRVVEELLVEIHLLRVNDDFAYDPIFALGILTTFERFMQGYRPETDRLSIFNALCAAEGFEAERLKQDTELLQREATTASADDCLRWVETAATMGGNSSQNTLRTIATNSKFKYSRLFAIGLLTLLENAEPSLLKDEARLTEVLKQLAQSLNLPADKQLKDLEQYRGNLEKLAQARKTLEEIVESERRRRQQASTDKENADKDKEAAPAEAESASASESTT
jgi:photosystem II biogenesis protein Psp29